jgi:hypothetical protein
MNKIPVEQWLANIHHLLIVEHDFTDDEADELLSGEWTDAFYYMWKEGHSCEEAVDMIIDENQPWNYDL